MLSSQYNSTLTLEEQQAWSRSISQRLDQIYKELCEYEQVLNEAVTEEPMKLMELLETVNDLHITTSTIRTHDAGLKVKQHDLQQQMLLLQKSVELLKLNCKSNESQVEEMD